MNKRKPKVDPWVESRRLYDPIGASIFTGFLLLIIVRLLYLTRGNI